MSVAAKAGAIENLFSLEDRIRDIESDLQFHPLYIPAMIKLSFEKKPGSWVGVDEIISSIVESMGSDTDQLGIFVASHRSELIHRCVRAGV